MRSRWPLLALLSSLLAACTFDEITIPKTTPTVVVHGVLNSSNLTQIVLLERSLSGSITIQDTTFDPNNPIATAGGLPIHGATAEIVDSTGRSVRAIEDRLATGEGTGVYRFIFALPLRTGGRYQLHVRTQEGEEVTAFTRIPQPVTTSTGALTRNFNRDHDTLTILWNKAVQTRSYAIRIESPFGPFFLFNDSTRFRIAGDARNLFSPDLQRVFIPGFRQDVMVAAVDSNFYDYYRTNNDPFTGSGIINRINGGIGLFGSLVSLSTGTLTTIADQTEPIEGRFRLTPASTDQTAPATITLYIESKSARADVPDALSGRYTTTGSGGRSDGIIGQIVGGTHVTLAFLANQLSTDTVDVFQGELSNGTITGSYRKREGGAVFVKQ